LLSLLCIDLAFPAGVYQSCKPRYFSLSNFVKQINAGSNKCSVFQFFQAFDHVIFEMSLVLFSPHNQLLLFCYSTWPLLRRYSQAQVK